jgi:hypothetical protein
MGRQTDDVAGIDPNPEFRPFVIVCFSIPGCIPSIGIGHASEFV